MRKKDLIKKIEKLENISNENNTLKNKNDFLERELKGYYNQETLLISEGLIFRDKELFKIDLILFDYFKKLMRGLFTYNNLPKDIPEDFIETNLFDRNLCFYEKAGKYYISKYEDLGYYDGYNEPLKIQPIIENGATMGTYKVNEDVVILKGTKGLPLRIVIDPFIKRLNLNNEASNRSLRLSMIQKLFTSSSKADINTLKKVFQKTLDTGGGIAFLQQTDDVYKIEDFELFKEFDNTNYWEDFQNIFNFIHTLLGVETNNNEDKRERLIVDEVNITNEKTNIIINEMIEVRKEWVNKINEMFNLDVKLILKNKRKEGIKNEESDND